MGDRLNDTGSRQDAGTAVPVALANRLDFALGNVKVRPSLRSVDGPIGTAKAEPRVMQVLLSLADARGSVLSRDDLLQQCWDGRIVGDDAINRAIAEVRRLAAAVGANFMVETVPRIGYRITGIDWDSEPVPDDGPARQGPSRRKVMAGGAATVALVTTGAAAVIYRSRNAEIDALIARGRELQGSGFSDGDIRARSLFREALARDPSRAEAWGWLAVVSEDPDAAREAAQRALSLAPREPNARSVLAYQLRDLESWTTWEDALLGVLADAPDCVLALDNLTFFYQGMGRCQDSWKANERSNEAEPFNPAPLHRRALKLWNFGRTGEADKVIDQTLHLWPRNVTAWNARMLIYACTDRAPAGLALLDDQGNRPANLKEPSERTWRAALEAIASRTRPDIDRAMSTFAEYAPLAVGIAANAIMISSYLGELDAAYRFAEGLFEKRGPLVPRARGEGIRDMYSASGWGRTQFLFIPATAPFRADVRFPDLCRRMGHVDYWRKRGIWPDTFVRGALDPAKFV